MALPENITFKTAFLSLFDVICDNDYRILRSIYTDSCKWHPNRDDICCDLANAIENTIQTLMVDIPDDPETHGELADWVCDNWPALNDYLVRTTE